MTGPRGWQRRELLIAAGACLLSTRVRAQVIPGRRLKLKNVNTGETFDGPYRDQQGPIPDAIADLAVLLRDHHVDKVGPVSVATLDFLADVLDAVGQSAASILSAYRTPETNAKLAKTIFGVAENSQHMFGRAVDISLPARLADAEIAARRMSLGGVGWYPRSRFIHLDSGPVRTWELDGTGFTNLLTAGGRPRTVAGRLAMQRELARREFLARRGAAAHGT